MTGPRLFPTPLETERMTLRRYELGDAGWYYAMSGQNRQHLARYEAGNPALALTSVEEAEAFIDDLVLEWSHRTYFLMGAFERATGNFVAQIYVGCRNLQAADYEIGYFADVGHEGCGFVSEAVRSVIQVLFEEMEAQRLSLECDDTNERSARVAERCGFVLEGHIRRNRRNPDGSVSGTLHYGMLREEYAQQTEGLA